MLCINCNIRPAVEKFCSRSCSSTFNNILRSKNKPILYCITCNKILVNRRSKYCSKICFTGGNRSLETNLKVYKCLSCDNPAGIGWKQKRKFCKDCVKSNNNPNYKDWSKITIKDFKLKLKNIYQFNARIRSLARAIYIKNIKDCICKNCRYSKHFEICHIKPIKDFDDQTPISVVNDISNLISLCPNCHWELDNGFLKMGEVGNARPRSLAAEGI